MDWIDARNIGLLMLAIALLNFPFALYQLRRKAFSLDRASRPFKFLAPFIVTWVVLKVLHRAIGASAYNDWLLTAALFVGIALAFAVPFAIGRLLGQAIALVVWKWMKTRP